MMQVLNETSTTTIGTLFESVTTVITNILSLFATVAETLLQNPIFQITIGVVILGIVMGLVFTMLRKLRKRGK